MYLWVTHAIFVPGRGRIRNNYRVHDAARANLDALGGKICVDGIKQFLNECTARKLLNQRLPNADCPVLERS